MIKNLLNLFFPKVCYACNNLLGDNEKHICITCRHNLPVTNYHFENNEAIKKVLYGRVKMELGTALLKFEKKGIVQHLLHNLKYKGHETIGKVLGEWLGNELKTIKAYNTIDAIIPVPLHKRKLRKRGYNQVEKFGVEIAKALDAEYIDTVLLKTTSTKTQVFKKRIARWDNSNEVFTMQNESLIKGKHILLVDDIITTGATIESCANILLKAENVKISVATMAIA
ncbi:Competence protein F homolog, phosphoribosyltransferase domain; protein YhgH required for utilization of DNA as sole source of carbon and energy [hydrothermal vent metagenome]|uniref:Competence protein F homolog, phosphoribosyltransferase domain protein YhgH required for utilization of DNA as sole source of carbon and energy n=1 Tax=hydrothermal vent metagenome TaxID=652676 RepID=A0A3B0R0S7_9ZZZZ